MAAIDKHPLRATAVGVAAIVILPILVVVLIMTLVGAPVAIALLVLLILSLLFAPVPAVTALGARLLRGRRWGLFASFVLGATIWRIGIWIIPWVGFALYLGALAAGLGGWLLAMWEQRREGPVEEDLLPPRAAKRDDIPSPVGWDAPLAPGTSSEANSDDSTHEP